MEHLPTNPETGKPDAEPSKGTEHEKTIAELRKEIERLRTMAYTDHLTGLDNRRKFDEEFDRRKEHRRERGAEKENAQDVLLILDIDNFKIVNDAFDEGHAGGDRVLKEAAEHILSAIKDHFRKDDVVARYGGEEFAILLKDADMESVGQRLRLGLTVTLDGEPIPITFSGGYTPIAPGETLDDAFTRADRALFVAKEDENLPDGRIKRGRNQILPYSEEMEEKMEKEKAGLTSAGKSMHPHPAGPE